ncbi:hypothetical protein G6F50_018280 [Rhizopus delemar]|uniref:Uncharacterized protein n=1 Tax=Rhizopus delemar TaxID=936053 RepID=A0A9P6XN94_9FUNG|nr:hypothetical protein G6F50_018280 [Rhizopus delemar]
MMAIGSVVRPGPTSDSDSSRFSNDTTKLNSAAAPMDGRSIGSVTRMKATGALAPRLRAASSMEPSRPAMPAVTRRTVHGIVRHTCAMTRPPKVPMMSWSSISSARR